MSVVSVPSVSWFMDDSVHTQDTVFATCSLQVRNCADSWKHSFASARVTLRTARGWRGGNIMQAVYSASLASMHEHTHTHARVSVYVRYIDRCRRVRPIFQQCSTRLLLDAETQIHSPVEPSQRNKDDTSTHGSYLARYSSTLRVPIYAV